ncbi:LuxR C-terminal-related transcriptional regulator [Muricauda oceani]|uniref:HTH luxR-type domain-containing protein n=1 Tax=Flagellimonas oceani TaxID=2698672 RepID=A0A6G7J8Z2_9FLAO|nr:MULTISPECIES: helix-turn-helix transcriptional regulator [Allomuricauda]MAM17359.1 LuxR family transcriptional regulator [Christiangramia sp.]MBW8241986.1 LuxR C-terminal-related transcriptional regulator [Allomuricauda oceani]QII46897.1 hypothetical protein GVT53_20170 [Allomuricauda oceani]|tara:strand:- start:5239 stop:6186 length:948 start_codon:yes stop_codon:yes gene_type:complete
MTVFGSEMHIVTFFIIAVQLILLTNFVIISLKKRDSKSTNRFIWFTISLISYNFFSGIFPDTNIPIPLSIQYIVAYGVGLYTALYYVYYVYSEFDIGHLKFFTLRHLMIILISAFIFFFVLPLIIWQDIGIAKYSFIFIPVAVAIAFLVKISTPLIELYKEKGGATNRFYRDRIATGYLTLLSIVLMPIIVALGDFQVVEQLTVNGGYFVLAVALIRINIYQDLKKEQFLHRLGYTDDAREAKNIAILKYFSKLDLSKREIEVANLILEGKSYKQIGSYLFIAEGTVSKHASNIFKKAEVQNRREFERRFKGKRK